MPSKTFKYFILIAQLSGLATSLAGEIAQALSDGVLNGSELGSIISRFITNLRMVGVSQGDIGMIQMVTTRVEFDQLDFKDGDILVYGPSELTDKLEVKV